MLLQLLLSLSDVYHPQKNALVTINGFPTIMRTSSSGACCVVMLASVAVASSGGTVIILIITAIPSLQDIEIVSAF
jgi:hypothetical protein